MAGSSLLDGARTRRSRGRRGRHCCVRTWPCVRTHGLAGRRQRHDSLSSARLTLLHSLSARPLRRVFKQSHSSVVIFPCCLCLPGDDRCHFGYSFSVPALISGQPRQYSVLRARQAPRSVYMDENLQAPGGRANLFVPVPCLVHWRQRALSGVRRWKWRACADRHLGSVEV
jgi:hypothetical protein